MIHHIQAIIRWKRFMRSGSWEDLEEAIKLYRVALDLRPKGHPCHSISLNRLALSLRSRFLQYGRIEDLEESVTLHRDALELRPEVHPNRPNSLNNLASSLQTRFLQYGRTEDLEEVIKLYRDALALRPEGHPDRSMSLNNLASSLQTRFLQYGRPEDLEESVRLHRDALALRPEGHPERSSSLNNLASSLQTRFSQYGKTEDLEEVGRLHRDALELRTEGHPNRHNSLNNLALSLQTRFLQDGRSEDLEEVIKLHRDALELRPGSHPSRSMSLNNLASSLHLRFLRCGRSEDLEEVVKLLRDALKLRPEGHPDRSMSLNNLASSLRTRFSQFGRIADLEESVKLHRDALELRPEGHPGRSMSLSNLALSLETQFSQYGRIDDLEESVKLHRGALGLRPEGHPDRFTSLNNLASSLSTRFSQYERTEDLEESVKLHRDALKLCPEGHPNRSNSLNNLALCLETRFSQYERIEDLEESVKLHRGALELRPEGHPFRSSSLRNLADSLYTRVKRRWCMKEFEECMLLLELAATDRFSGTLVRLLAAQRWAEVARLHNHDTAFAAYKATISLLQHALIITPTLREQHDFLIGKNDRRVLTLEAASYAIEKNQLKQAVEILEQGRGLLWSQLRGFRTPLDRLAEKNRELADRFRDVSRRLENLATSHEALLSKEQEEVINEIRRVPGFENFLGATPFKLLQQAAPEGPIIIVNHCEYRSDALIILFRDVSPVVCIPLDDEFYNDSITLCNELVDTRQRLKSDPLEYDVKLREAMKLLWDRVVSKVTEKLEELGIIKGSRIWWCPTSVLSTLPFHAAGPFEDADGTTRYLLDIFVSSYTPTLGALIHAQSNSSTSEPKLLVIADTVSLHSTRQEVRNIRNCMGSDSPGTTILLDRRASRRTVMKNLRKVTWVHFACHGHLDPKPFDSSFKLADRDLTLLDVVQANVPNAEFAFLSACHTAELSRSGAHDEALHLSAAMQFSGFRSVIGTMWELYDEDGPFFTRVVYEYMNRYEDGEVKHKRAAAGLREAALKLKAKDGIPTERWVNFVHIGA
ncbi:TPR-like protein [Fomitiporia mediterranea MF3/22]|uniref:TPR-like protein n=1 Tax=Fomitiporia mediterranea (strain MF3/22) TaxID=694068 RepID=UPI0004407E74|nr:TPR-like protein [Fomitiporia mediterranea MF3/22]EJD03367.1 TPR-like protein [Fomitiporia mediterranea MF3/22]